MSLKVPKRQSKAVTIAYASLAVIILLLIVAVALVVVPPSPPSVSEFAPQAVDQIVQAPDQQSSQFGKGAGACATGQVCDGPNQTSAVPAPKKVIEKARVRRCVGDPPRQIEDPQSPPCVNFWEGNNGGVTTKGVTRDEIRIAWPRFQGGAIEEVVDSLVLFFNKRFELYGRKIRLMKYALPSNSGTDTTMRATAVKIDEELGAFAAFPYPGSGMLTGAYYDEMARRGVIGVNNHMDFNTEKANYSPRRPFAWSYTPSLDKYQHNQVEWFCKGLAGRPASLAGPEFQISNRKVGILAVRTPAGVPDTSVVKEGMSGCTSSATPTIEFNDASNEAERTSALNSLHVSGVTSVTCYCDGNDLIDFMNYASQAGYFPEWMLNPFYGQDDDAFGRNQPPEQRSHAFGLTSLNKLNQQQDSPWYWAATETNPTYSNTDYGAVGAPALLAYVPFHYEVLLLLASGIQMAGPNLTPNAFENALFKTKFSNPGAGEAPYFQGRVGFGPGDHTMIQNLAMIWYDDSAQSYGGHGTQTGRGSYCYVERGKRYGLGQWPQTTPRYLDRTAPCR